ncbi:unnamed protein product [Closterium sp. NIES-54]
MNTLRLSLLALLAAALLLHLLPARSAASDVESAIAHDDFLEDADDASDVAEHRILAGSGGAYKPKHKKRRNAVGDGEGYCPYAGKSGPSPKNEYCGGACCISPEYPCCGGDKCCKKGGCCQKNGVFLVWRIDEGREVRQCGCIFHSLRSPRCQPNDPHSALPIATPHHATPCHTTPRHTHLSFEQQLCHPCLALHSLPPGSPCHRPPVTAHLSPPTCHRPPVTRAADSSRHATPTCRSGGSSVIHVSRSTPSCFAISSSSSFAGSQGQSTAVNSSQQRPASQALSAHLSFGRQLCHPCLALYTLPPLSPSHCPPVTRAADSSNHATPTCPSGGSSVIHISHSMPSRPPRPLTAHLSRGQQIHHTMPCHATPTCRSGGSSVIHVSRSTPSRFAVPSSSSSPGRASPGARTDRQHKSRVVTGGQEWSNKEKLRSDRFHLPHALPPRRPQQLVVPGQGLAWCMCGQGKSTTVNTVKNSQTRS